MKVNKILIVGRKKTPLVQNTLLRLQKILDSMQISHHLEDELISGISASEAPSIAPPDLVISVGGDGCLLAAAQWAIRFDVPIIGINCGRLGFLGDLTPQQLDDLPTILTGENSDIEARSVLQIEDKKVINEVLIAGDCLGVLATLQVEVDNTPLCIYQADGLIISTATGSTGHALSCGGPILEPTSQQIILVPLASHKLSSRPLVITPQKSIKIRMLGKQNGSIVIDGRRYAAGREEVTVGISSRKLKMMHPASYDFFAALRSKLEWEK